jgi:hypothetical protein
MFLFFGILFWPGLFYNPGEYKVFGCMLNQLVITDGHSQGRHFGAVAYTASHFVIVGSAPYWLRIGGGIT